MFEIVSNKTERGYLLRTLKIGYPGPTGSHLLEVCLLDAGMPVTRVEVEAHLQYLEEKGYVRTSRAKLEITGTPILLATLTPRGIDLLEKTIDDPGVLIR
jgi:hypothetical protein